MELPLQITVHNTELDASGRELIRKHAAKLTQFYDRLTACDVRVDVPQRRRIGEPICYNVRLALAVPRDEIVVTRQRRAILHEAIQSAFEAATRRLQDYAVRQRSAVKRPVGRGAESGR